MTAAELAHALGQLDAVDRARFVRAVLEGARGRLVDELCRGGSITRETNELLEEETARACAFMFAALAAREEGA